MDETRVTFHPAAEIELYDAALYYESQRGGLGSTFLQAIETAMDEIHENPMASPRVRGVVRSKRGSAVPLFSHVLCGEWGSPDSRHLQSKAPTTLLVKTPMNRYSGFQRMAVPRLTLA